MYVIVIDNLHMRVSHSIHVKVSLKLYVIVILNDDSLIQHVCGSITELVCETITKLVCKSITQIVCSANTQFAYMQVSHSLHVKASLNFCQAQFQFQLASLAELSFELYLVFTIPPQPRDSSNITF